MRLEAPCPVHRMARRAIPMSRVATAYTLTLALFMLRWLCSDSLGAEPASITSAHSSNDPAHRPIYHRHPLHTLRPPPTRFAAIENLKARWLRTLITLKRHDEAAELALAGALAWPRMPSDFGFWIFDLRLGEGRAGVRRRAVRDLRGSSRSNATTTRPNWRWRACSPGREGCKILDFQIIDAAHARRQGLSRRRRGGDLAAAGHRGHRQKDHRKNPDRRQQCASTEAHRVLSRPAMPVVRDYTVRG
jgi:hypothetical protein